MKLLCNLFKLICILIFQVDDSRAAMLLYQKNRKEWEKSVKDQIRLKEKQKKRKPRKKPKSDSNHVPTAS